MRTINDTLQFSIASIKMNFKMNVMLTLFSLGFLCQSALSQSSTDKLKVSLYYEALCPYSIEFITQQFYPNYGKIGSYLLLDLVPYGNARRNKVNGTWHFDCQHGPPECALNKLQGCGLAKIADQDKDLEFVNCVESHVSLDVDEDELAEICAPILGLPAKVLLECSKGEEGNDILDRLGARTDAVQPPLRGVPRVIFNDDNDKSLNDKARDDFLGTACLLLHHKPKACPSSNEIFSNSSSSSFSSSTSSPSSYSSSSSSSFNIGFQALFTIWSSCVLGTWLFHSVLFLVVHSLIF